MIIASLRPVYIFGGIDKKVFAKNAPISIFCLNSSQSVWPDWAIF